MRPIKGRSGRGRYALLAKMWVSVSVFSRSFLCLCSLFSPLPYLPSASVPAEHAAAACRLKARVGVCCGEEAAAAAEEKKRKTEEKQRCNTGALGACESAFAALRCAEGERKVSYQTAKGAMKAESGKVEEREEKMSSLSL